MTRYRVNDVFRSIQGEGYHSGRAATFVRFAGCGLACAYCDTEFESGRFLDMAQLIEWISPEVDDWVVLTGGEPAEQVDRPLVDALHAVGAHVAIETNGAHCVEGLGLRWITVSPKVAEHAIKQKRADEVKYVRNYGQGIPKSSVVACHRYISPMFAGGRPDHRTISWCIGLVRQNPEWRLTVQMHRLLGVR